MGGEPVHDEDVIEVRAGPGMRILAAIGLPAVVGFEVFVAASLIEMDRGIGEKVAIMVLDLLLGVALALGSWRILGIGLHLSDAGLTIRNFFKVHHIRLADIETFEANDAYYGIRARLKDGRAFTVTAVQKWRLAGWTHIRTRPDQVVDELNGWLARRRGRGDGTAVSSRAEE